MTLPSLCTSEPSTLKEAYEADFLLGAAVGTGRQNQDPIRTLLRTQFHVLTPENCMKPALLQPEEGRFTFEAADALVEFAEANQKKLVGHTLVWHNQTPEWFFKNENGDKASRDVVLERLQAHISTVVGRYKGRILGWDVVNEAISDKKEEFLRPQSPWVHCMGEDYIEKAFEFAHAADPDAELYYNDYNIEQPEKLEKTIRIVKRLQAKGLRIDGVGIQGHWGKSFPLKNIEAAIQQLSALGVKVMFTEVDMNVLPGRPPGADVTDKSQWSAELDPYQNGCPPEILQKQAEEYAKFFRLLKKYPDQVTRVTFWGVTDKDSWLNNWPIKGRTNYPLLFDREGNPKPAYHAVIKASREP
jgi:endo-1,4-beta-xylanase